MPKARNFAFLLSLLSFAVLPFSPRGYWAGTFRAASVAGTTAARAGCAAMGGPLGEDSGHGFDLASLDRAISPCDDFYRFADGGWMARNPIPAAYPSWGSFNKLQDANQEHLHQILEDAAKQTHAARGSNLQKIGDFYAACMDAPKIEAQAAKPLQPEFARIAALKDVPGLQDEVARLQQFGVNAVFVFSSRQDFKNSSEEIGAAAQGGLGLPDRDYYTKTDEKSQALRQQYLQHVQKMFELLGDSPQAAAAEAKTVMGIETGLAQSSMTRVERRSPENVYHRMDRAQLENLTPHFAWVRYFREVGFPAISIVNVGQPEFFKALDVQWSQTSLADWKTYLRWHLIHAAAPQLSENFVNEDFNFYGRALTGTTEILPRWKRCVRSANEELGEALGQFYVAQYFPPPAKASALDMVHKLIAALHDDLATLDWMGPETRQQALRKLSAIALKIGYPDKWRDYSAYQVARSSWLQNQFAGEQFEFRRQLAKIGKPVDRTEWEMTPPTVNAYYRSQTNEIVFPAGILQPPFFDPQSDDALNFGGMGAVIGHELTHGFDDQGRKFDAQGNLRNWWTPEDLKNFEQRALCVEKQFDGFFIEGGLHENGKLVLGESIADLGGLTIAHAAFQTTPEAASGPKEIQGFTPEQRFFLAWARIWASNIRPEFARLLVNTNEHPLGRFRTDGPLSNMPSFAQAYGCAAGKDMVRPESQRCRIW